MYSLNGVEQKDPSYPFIYDGNCFDRRTGDANVYIRSDYSNQKQVEAKTGLVVAIGDYVVFDSGSFRVFDYVQFHARYSLKPEHIRLNWDNPVDPESVPGDDSGLMKEAFASLIGLLWRHYTRNGKRFTLGSERTRMLINMFPEIDYSYYDEQSLRDAYVVLRETVIETSQPKHSADDVAESILNALLSQGLVIRRSPFVKS